MEFIKLEEHAKHIHIALSKTHEVLSSAVFNGGLCKADHIVNMFVPEIDCEDITESPQTTISKYCDMNSWSGTCVGMMTSASTKSFQCIEDTTQDVKTTVFLTAGLGNVRCAGDPAEHRNMVSSNYETGTINIILATTARLLPKALVESVQTITEAKTATLQKFNIKSPVSGLTATGTGTDSVAIINGQDNKVIEYSGKHTLFGEIAANLVMTALEDSIKSTN